jgi:hypothetical protein
MDSPFYLNLVQQTLQHTTRVMPKTFTLNVDYDLIKFEDGYEKPSREVFYSKYNELLRNIHLETLRNQRNEKLQQSDFSMLPDHRLSRENEEEWKVYRQALRDIPSTTEDPENPVWPEPPKVKVTTSGSTTRTELEQALETEKQKTENLQTRLTASEQAYQSLLERVVALENA